MYYVEKNACHFETIDVLGQCIQLHIAQSRTNERMHHHMMVYPID